MFGLLSISSVCLAAADCFLFLLTLYTVQIVYQRRRLQYSQQESFVTLILFYGQ
jgi:hypothetical protein